MSRSRVCVAAVSLLVCALNTGARCMAADEQDDDQLIKAVQEAVKSKAKIGDIEKVVGQRATINTSRPRDKNALHVADIVLDRKKCDLASLTDAKDAVYWVLAAKTKNPSLVGVAWTETGEMKIFFGVVLPP